MSQPYDTAFFDGMVAPSSRSAEIVAPMIKAATAPATMIDIGCGTGGWVRAFQAIGVEAYGVDGDYVDRALLKVQPSRFHSADLTRPLTLPDAWPGSFDLAISLEVAEHLPEAAADTLVETMTGLSSCVLFSAAIPHQGGTHHVNEQWQSYWAQRFQDRGYVVVDAIRPKIWDLPDMAYIYAQNTLLYVRAEVLDRAPELQPYVRDAQDGLLSVVHPRKWVKQADPARQSLRKVLTSLPRAIQTVFEPRPPPA